MFDPGLLLTSGYEARREGRSEDARDLFAQAVAESRFSPDRTILARALKALAQIERDLHHRSSALKCYREAAEIQRELADQLGWAHTVRHIADVLREQNSLSEAETSYSQALEVYRNHPDSPVLDRANALRGYALLKDKAGNHDDALLMWCGAKALYETAGVPAGVAECASQIAFLLGH